MLKIMFFVPLFTTSLPPPPREILRSTNVVRFFSLSAVNVYYEYSNTAVMSTSTHWFCVRIRSLISPARKSQQSYIISIPSPFFTMKCIGAQIFQRTFENHHTSPFLGQTAFISCIVFMGVNVSVVFSIKYLYKFVFV